MARFFAIPARNGKPDGPSQGTSPQRLALLIGNGKYSGGRLTNPVRDAELLASVLKGIGFDVRVVRDATKSALDRAIIEFGARLEEAGKDAVAFFYYAGHGIQHDGQNYLIPVDADIPDARYLKSDAVAVSSLLDEVARAPHCACAVVLDACRNNPLAATRGARSTGQGLAPAQHVPAGTLMAFSTAAGAIAVDHDPRTGDNSPYATLLANRLAEPGLLLREVFHGVAEEMHALSGGTQNPFMAVQVFPRIVLVPKPEPAQEAEGQPGRQEGGAALRALPLSAPPSSRAWRWVRRAAMAACLAVTAVWGAAAAPDAWVDYLPPTIADNALPRLKGLPVIRSLPFVAAPMPPMKLNIVLADLAGDEDRGAMTRLVETALKVHLDAGTAFSPVTVRHLKEALPCSSADAEQRTNALRAAQQRLLRHQADLLVCGATEGSAADGKITLRYVTARDTPEAEYSIERRTIPASFDTDIRKHLARGIRNRDESSIAALFDLFGIGIKSTFTAAFYDPQRESKYDAASIADMSKEIETNPRDAEAYVKRADIYRLRGEFASAIADATKAVAVNDRHASAYAIRGDAFRLSGDLKSAIKDLDKAIGFERKYAFAYAIRGDVLRQQALTSVNTAQLRRQAIADATTAIELYRARDLAADLLITSRLEGLITRGPLRGFLMERAFPFATRGEVYFMNNDLDLAIADLNEAIDLGNRSAFAIRGVAHLRKGRHDQALADLTRAIEVNPSEAELYRQRGIARWQKQDYDGFIADMTEAIKIDGKSASDFARRSMAYLAKGEPDLAIDDLGKAIGIYGERAREDTESNEFKEFLESLSADNRESFNRLLTHADNLALAFALRGAAYKQKGEFDRAISDFSEAIKLDGKKASVYGVRGETYLSKGELDLAITDLDKAIGLDGKFARDHESRGRARAAKGDYAGAIADYDRAIAIDPKDAWAYGYRGIARFCLGELRAAVTDLNAAIERGAYPAYVMFRYLARARLGEEALSELQASAGQFKGKDSSPVGVDRDSWFMAFVDLYAGGGTTGEVLALATSDDRRCEAHFYIGQWHLLAGRREEAKAALETAVATCSKSIEVYPAAAAELARLGSTPK